MNVVYLILFLFLLNNNYSIYSYNETFQFDFATTDFVSDIFESISDNNQKNNSVKDISSESDKTYESCVFSCDGHEQLKSHGFSEQYHLNCRNREDVSNYEYGSRCIPFWINLDSINTIHNIEHRNIFLSDIREQISIWNKAEMHDGSGILVNIYEVGRDLTSKPSEVDGCDVVEIQKYESKEHSGEFWFNTLQLKINYNPTFYGVRPGRNVDTPMHEVGHLLGLSDLDGEDFPSGTHKALMGYSRNTEISKIFDAITYHDIQGVACANNIHKDHLYLRYYYKNGVYRHVCFYCDFVNTLNAPLDESEQFIYASNCSHDYEPMVSLGEKHWLKCIYCYKVIEHYHSFNYSYINCDAQNHFSYCECGDYIYSKHDFSNHYCIFCGRYTSTHDFHEPYKWINSSKHEATCGCGTKSQIGHVVASDISIDPFNPYKKKQCLLCGGTVDVGFEIIHSTNDVKYISKNGSYVLPNGVYILQPIDIELLTSNSEFIFDLNLLRNF